MTTPINIRIELIGELTHQNDIWTQKLQHSLEKKLEIPFQATFRKASPNTMSGGEIVQLISGASLVVSSLALVLQSIRFYLDEKRRAESKTHQGSITVSAPGLEITKPNLSDEEIEDFVQRIRSNSPQDVTIKINWN